MNPLSAATDGLIGGGCEPMSIASNGLITCTAIVPPVSRGGGSVRWEPFPPVFEDDLVKFNNDALIFLLME